jgi:hypothetical protein
MKRLGLLAALLVVALAIGCDQGGGSSAKKGPAPSTDAAKAALNDMVTTGRLGSGMMAVDSYIGSLKASDPAKSEALAKDMNDLRGLGSKPDAFKAKAKEMAGKL